jgi:hypothetical protein
MREREDHDLIVSDLTFIDELMRDSGARESFPAP